MDEKLISRITVGVTVAGIAGGLLFLESIYPSLTIIGTILFLGVVCGCALEASLYSEKDLVTRSASFFLYIIPSFLYLFFSAHCSSLSLALCSSVFISLIFLLSISIFHLRNSIQNSEIFLSKLYLNFLVIGVGGASAVFISSLENAPRLIFISASIVALSDVIAFFVGPRFSILKLARGISPNKAVSGSLAAVCLGGVLGGVFGFFLLSLPFIKAVFFGVILASVSVVFDLAQSLSKRLSGVKDSGTLLKSHGGIFDRFDSHLGGMVVMTIFVLLTQ